MLINNKGLSLVEVLVAMVVFLLVSLAMMQTALVSIDSNMINILRDEAVRIAEQRMNEARTLPFNEDVDLLDSDGTDSELNSNDCSTGFFTQFATTGVLVKKNLKNISDRKFCTNRTVGPPINIDNKQVAISVGWKWKGIDYDHRITTIVRRQ